MNVKKVIVAYILYKRRLKRIRHVDLFAETRLLSGIFSEYLQELHRDERKFREYFRMSIPCFEEIFGRTEKKLTRSNIRRISISPLERLAISLRYMAAGTTITEMHTTYKFGISTIGKILRQTCSVICEELTSECIPKPDQNRWKEIADEFFENTQFPNCIGAIDGKHVRAQVIRQTKGTPNFKGKKYVSVVLLAMCDTNYMFTHIDVGAYGGNSIASIFKESKIYSQLANDTLDMPSPQPLPVICAANSSRPDVPFVIVGDGSFGSSSSVVRPYAGNKLAYKKKIFNYRQSRARRHIECAFGILSNKFDLYKRPLNVNLTLAQAVVRSTCILHNFILKREGYRIEDTFIINGFIDRHWPKVSENNSNRSYYALRDTFAEYFLNEGAVPWQDRYIVNRLQLPRQC